MSGAVEAPTITEKIGRYDVVGQLAIGGMATIHLARLSGPRGFEQAVVIKSILPHLATMPEFVDMFVDEARIVAGIRHPNVVHVHELGHEGDRLFLVMEYLEGESVGGLMRRLLAKGDQLDRALAIHIVAEACAGLHAAHELVDDAGKPRGLVHRDVSPQNVFVTYSGAVKVLDFGIAKVAGRATRTEAGQLKGKFEYMSPEQCASKPLDRRSDVFALGILLYELSTGRRLFKRENELETLKAICEQPVTRPSEVVRGYPLELESICIRALARRPADRYATAAEMRRDLIGLLRGAAGDVLQEEALGQLMKRVFSDRIADKREMLRRVSSGAPITHIPAAEIDGSIDMPVVEDGSVFRSTSDVVTEPEKRRPPRFALPLAIGALGAGLVAFAWHRRPIAPPVEAQRDVASATPAATTSTGVVAPEVKPADVLLHIETTPPGAHVTIAGEDRGLSPIDVRIARTGQPVRLDVVRDGFAPLSQNVATDVDQRLALTLRALGRAKTKPASATPRAAAPTAAPSEEPYHRF